MKHYLFQNRRISTDEFQDLLYNAADFRANNCENEEERAQ